MECLPFDLPVAFILWLRSAPQEDKESTLSSWAYPKNSLSEPGTASGRGHAACSRTWSSQDTKGTCPASQETSLLAMPPAGRHRWVLSSLLCLHRYTCLTVLDDISLQWSVYELPFLVARGPQDPELSACMNTLTTPSSPHHLLPMTPVSLTLR